MRDLGSVEKLTAYHRTENFDCGNDGLNRFLRQFALVNQKANSAQTYVCARSDQTVTGYYSLSVSGVEWGSVPQRIAQGLARHAIPVMLLARLAIHKEQQGHGLGKALLKDALLRTAHAAEIAGVRALLVHAKDGNAREWYEHFNFMPSPSDPLHLYLLMKDIYALLK